MDIHGVGIEHDLTDTGVIDRPRDFSMLTMSSITPNGADFDHRTGSGAADGTFVVPVGMGAATWDLGLMVGTKPPTYLVGNSTAPDLSLYHFGRGDVTFATASNPVTITATGLAPWGAIDDLEVMSANAGAVYLSPQTSFATPLTAGSTTIASQSYESSAQGGPLIVAAKGDSTVLFQLSTQTSGADQYAAISKLGTATGFTQTDGQPSTMTVALADVAQTKTLTVHWKRSQFEALKAQVGPGAVDFPGGAVLAIDALPQAIAHGLSGPNTPDLVEFFSPPVGSTDLDETFTYGNPFSTMGTPWDEYLIAAYDFHVPVLAAGATTPFNLLQVGIVVNLPVGMLAATGIITPPISPVTNITIGGMDVSSTAKTGVGLTPMIAWTAPTIGTASGYLVTILLVSLNQGATQLKAIGTFETKATSLQVPDALLSSGMSYILVIKATAIPGTDITTAPFLKGLPDLSATTATAQFKP